VFHTQNHVHCKAYPSYKYQQQYVCTSFHYVLLIEFASLAPALPFGYDLERVIDDFVFCCFFVGNDFLPHLPSLDIRRGAIDLIMALYKQLLPGLAGYLTAEGTVDLSPVDVLLSRVGGVEDEIFRRRRGKEERDKVFEGRRKQEREGGAPKTPKPHQNLIQRQYLICLLATTPSPTGFKS